MILGSRGCQAVTHHPDSPSPLPRIGRQTRRGSSRRHFRQKINYADGGRSTCYLGSDDDDVEIQGNNDSPGTPRTHRYTFEEKHSDRSSPSSKPSSSSLLTPSSPIMMIVPPTTAFIIDSKSPLRYPSLEI